jgi:competence ComEA-like helix-hairpin-helix protein
MPEETEEAVPSEPDLNDMDAAFAWLESLAAKQGVEEGMLLKPEERSETPPDWIQEAMDAQPEGQEPGQEEMDELGVPEWLQGLEAGLEESSLGDTKPTRATREAAKIQAEATEQAEEPEALPDWLAATVPIPPRDEIPAEVDEEAVVIPIESESEDMEATFAWLEGLAGGEVAEEAEGEETGFTAVEAQPQQAQEDVIPEEPARVELQVPGVEDAEESVEEASEQSMPIEARIEQAFAESSQAEEETATPEALMEGAVETGPEADQPGAFEEAFETPAAESVLEEAAPEDFTAEPETAVPEISAAPLSPSAEPVEDQDWTPTLLEEQPLSRIDLNTASLVELERLPQIGFRMAQEIVSYREQQGPYRSLDDLTQVQGFDPAVLEDLRDRLFVELPLPESAAPAEHDMQEPAPAAPEEVRSARSELATGNIEKAVETYTSLVRSRRYLPEIIQDLTEAAKNYPEDVNIWQALGDAYMRADRLQEALEAYTKAEELLG